MNDRRIPFEVAINDPRLLKTRFDELSLGQRAVLKTLYACPLDPKTQDRFGWTEVDYWDAGQGRAEYDEFGYLQSVGHETYVPKKYSEAWVIAGRRGGKSDSIAATIVVYEAALGGHEDYVRKGQSPICFQIAQDLRMARYALSFIVATLESSPILSKQMTARTADRVDLRNGLTIAVVPPTVKSVRGYASPVSIFDEVGVWYQDAEAANPDYEIRRAVTPAQLQFPNRLTVGISSPWNKAGLLYQYFEAGTDGKNAPEAERDLYKDTLVWHSPSACLRSDTHPNGTPRIPSTWFITEQAKDPRAFERECMAIFQDSVTGFLSSDLLRAAVEKGIAERAPEASNVYMAAIDPAFRRDAFALVIAHATSNGHVVIDCIRRWLPEKGVPLNPTHIFQEMVPILRAYRVMTITSDQYHLDTLQQLALSHNFAIDGVPFTAINKASIYGNLQQLLNQRRLHLLDNAEALRELRSLERRLTKMGLVQISGAPGMHDDVASAIALAVHKTSWMLPVVQKAPVREPSPFERINAQIARKRSAMGGSEVWD